VHISPWSCGQQSKRGPRSVIRTRNDYIFRGEIGFARYDEHEYHAYVDTDVGAAEKRELSSRKTVYKAMDSEYANIEADDLFETHRIRVDAPSLT
jgi:hypothetical protein